MSVESGRSERCDRGRGERDGRLGHVAVVLRLLDANEFLLPDKGILDREQRAVVAIVVVVGLVFLARCIAPVRTVLGGAAGPSLVPVLGATGAAELIWSVAVAVPLLVA